MSNINGRAERKRNPLSCDSPSRSSGATTRPSDKQWNFYRKMTAGNAGNIKLVYQIYRDIRLESAKSNSRETVFWTSLCSHTMKYFRKSIFPLLLQWIWRLGMCPWSWHCHPTVHEGSQLVERLGLPTCTCPRSSNDRSQSLHLRGRFSLHIRNGQWGSAKPCKIMQTPLSFTRTSENFMPVPIRALRLWKGSISRVVCQVWHRNSQVSTMGRNHLEHLNAKGCQSYTYAVSIFTVFTFSRFQLTVFCTWQWKGANVLAWPKTCLDISCRSFCKSSENPSKHRYCEAPILPGKQLWQKTSTSPSIWVNQSRVHRIHDSHTEKGAMVGLPGWRSRTRTAPCSPLWGGDAQMTWWAQKITICYDLPHYNISHSKIFQNLQNFKKFFAEFETHSVHLCPPPRFGGGLSWHPKAWADSVFKLSFGLDGSRPNLVF